MFRRMLVILVLTVALLIPAAIISAQGPTATPTPFPLGTFIGSTEATPTPGPADALKQMLGQNNYTVVNSGAWFDTAGTPLSDSVYVLMLAASPDPKSSTSVQQIASGFGALRSTYPNAANFHVLLLNPPFVYDTSTTSNALQLLNSQLVSADSFLADVLARIHTTNLVSGAAASTGSTPVAQNTPVPQNTTAPRKTAVPTRAPTRVPTKAANTCGAPGNEAWVYIRNGYTGTMRFTIGGGSWGTHDYDIPADGKFYIIKTPGGTFTYSASIPGVGKASGQRMAYNPGQCYPIDFHP